MAGVNRHWIAAVERLRDQARNEVQVALETTSELRMTRCYTLRPYQWIAVLPKIAASEASSTTPRSARISPKAFTTSS